MRPPAPGLGMSGPVFPVRNYDVLCSRVNSDENATVMLQSVCESKKESITTREGMGCV